MASIFDTRQKKANTSPNRIYKSNTISLWLVRKRPDKKEMHIERISGKRGLLVTVIKRQKNGGGIHMNTAPVPDYLKPDMTRYLRRYKRG